MGRNILILLAVLLCAGELHALSVDDDKRSQGDNTVKQQPQDQKIRRLESPEKKRQHLFLPLNRRKESVPTVQFHSRLIFNQL